MPIETKMIFRSSRFNHRVVSLAIVGLILLAARFFDRQQFSLNQLETRDRALSEITTLQTHVEGLINRKLLLVEGMVAFRKSRKDFTMEEFFNFAYALEGKKRGIRSLQFAPDGIVK